MPGLRTLGRQTGGEQGWSASKGQLLKARSHLSKKLKLWPTDKTRNDGKCGLVKGKRLAKKVWETPGERNKKVINPFKHLRNRKLGREDRTKKSWLHKGALGAGKAAAGTSVRFLYLRLLQRRLESKSPGSDPPQGKCWGSA